MEIVAYLLSGALAGLMAGLLGVGGGLVIVPALAMLFARHGFIADSVMHYAVGTSLATIIPTSISSLLAHQRRASVYWAVVRSMMPGILLGALASAWLAKQLSSADMALVFAVLGIGGGTLTVPFLLWNQVDIRLAVGTAATIGLPIAIAGTIGFVISGLDAPVQPGFNSGFIYWPAVAGVVLASVPMAPVGARLAHYLPGATLQRLFALLLLVVAVKMIVASG